MLARQGGEQFCFAFMSAHFQFSLLKSFKSYFGAKANLYMEHPGTSSSVLGTSGFFRSYFLGSSSVLFYSLFSSPSTKSPAERFVMRSFVKVI